MAPMFEHEKNEQELVRQIIQEMQNIQTIDAVRDAARQLAVVNLWFFEKYVAGYNGPFADLNTDLHLDMANFCQDYVLVPGSMTAMGAPRFHFKSTVATTGFDAWEAIRWPDITIGLFHSIYEKATDFLHIIQRIFDSNELFAWLFPEYVPKRNSPRWNDSEMMLPPTVRKRFHNEATIECGSVGGTSQGRHYDKIDLDDIVGENDLNAERKSSIDMYKKVEWIKGIKRTLIMDWRTSRVCAKFTRYSVDDAYEPIMMNMKKLIIYDEHKLNYEVKPNGEWVVYYRFVEENGKIIFPERITKEKLDQMVEEDPWTYWTQFENNPQKSGLAEFSGYWVGGCQLDYDKSNGWTILFREDNEVKEWDLADCDLVVAGDPAATERYMSARTSRSAVVVLVHAPDDKRFIISIHADYVEITKFFDWLFDDARKFSGYLRTTYLEAQGPFKILSALLREEEQKKNMYLNLRPVSATRDKDVRIRSNVIPIVNDKLLYVDDNYRSLLMEEFKGFPQSQKKDILDALALGLANTNRPPTAEEKYAREEADEERAREMSYNVTGY